VTVLPEGTLVPARIVNEHVYCPRLAWLEWEAKAFTDNLDTVEGVTPTAASMSSAGSWPRKISTMSR
jgi:hypothetical protein